ncbi:MAG: zinc-ribbon domain-containing protein [Ruminococcus sp.]|nr:zinc-ribbon domain-containing protein [Ruminococcus sp.]
MFCEKCGNPINEGAKFCRVCGNKVDAVDVEKTETVSRKTIEDIRAKEPETVKSQAPASMAPKTPAKNSKLNENKTASPAKIATIAALSAPLIVIINYIIQSIAETLSGSLYSEVWELLRDIFSNDEYYQLANTFSDVIFCISGILCLAVAIGVYLLFTFKHRAKLPLFLCLIPVGAYIIASPVYTLIISIWVNDILGLFKFKSSLLWYLIQNLMFFPFVLIEAAIAYFILRSVMKKILKNSAIAEESKTEE